MSRHVVQEAPTPSLSVDSQKAKCWLADRLQAVVLLCGSVRQSGLGPSIKRSILDLPIDDSRTILNHWIQDVARLSQVIDRRKLPLRVMINAHAASPACPAKTGNKAVDVEIQTDAAEYRGTAGVLKDLSQAYDDDGLILVVNGPQVLLDPLADVAVALARRRSDVSLVSHEDGTPCGLMLVRCGELREIADVGFVDMKEQALPQIAKHSAVAVIQQASPTSLPIRGLSEYITALRAYHSAGSLGGGDAPTVDPYAEDWQPSFSISEPQAHVDPSAQIHDSVVLAGATVRRSAVLVRSVVCPGAVVGAGQTLTNRLVTDQAQRQRER